VKPQAKPLAKRKTQKETWTVATGKSAPKAPSSGGGPGATSSVYGSAKSLRDALEAQEERSANPTAAESVRRVRAAAESDQTIVEYYKDGTEEFLRIWLNKFLHDYLFADTHEDRETFEYWKNWAQAKGRRDADYLKAVKDHFGPCLIESKSSGSRRHYSEQNKAMCFSGAEIARMWSTRVNGKPRGYPQMLSPSKKMLYPIVENYASSYRFARNEVERVAAAAASKEAPDDSPIQDLSSALKEVGQMSTKVKEWDLSGAQFEKLMVQQRKTGILTMKKKKAILEFFLWKNFSARVKELLELGQVTRECAATALMEHKKALTHLQLKDMEVVNPEEDDDNIFKLLAYVNSGAFKQVELLRPKTSVEAETENDDEIDNLLSGLNTEVEHGDDDDDDVEDDAESDDDDMPDEGVDGLEDFIVILKVDPTNAEAREELLKARGRNLRQCCVQLGIDVPRGSEKAHLVEAIIATCAAGIEEDSKQEPAEEVRQPPAEPKPSPALPEGKGNSKDAGGAGSSQVAPPPPPGGKGGKKPSAEDYVEVPDGRRIPKPFSKHPQQFSKSQKTVLINHLYYAIKRCEDTSKEPTLEKVLQVLQKSLADDPSREFASSQGNQFRSNILEFVTRPHMARYFSFEGCGDSLDFSQIDPKVVVFSNKYDDKYIIPRDQATRWPINSDLANLADPLTDRHFDH